jgi:hypothetical protein
MDEVVAAEFGINVKGEVERLRVQFEEDCEMIEFVRGIASMVGEMVSLI